MAYRRPYRSNYNNYGPVKVSLTWSAMVGAYDLKFDNIGGHWDKVKAMVAWIKMTVPSGERDYDDVNKIWTISEKFFNDLKNVLSGISDFDVTIVEKPIGGSSVKFVATDTYLQRFKDLSGTDISQFSADQYTEAKKIYFRTAMKLHPDRHPNDSDAPKRMSEFNEAWDIIKERHFKIQRVMEQTQ